MQRVYSRAEGFIDDSVRSVVAVRKLTLMPLDDFLYAFQPTILHLTSSLGICRDTALSCLPELADTEASGKRFNQYSIGFFNADIASGGTSVCRAARRSNSLQDRSR